MVLSNDSEIARAFADDTAAVISDYVTAIPVLANLFKQCEEISGLALNVHETVFIPLWPLVDAKALRNLITELCPMWRNIDISTKGKYLGFQIGPGASSSSWTAPIDKYTKRVEAWSVGRTGLFRNSILYNTFIVTTLDYVGHLLCLALATCMSLTSIGSLARYSRGGLCCMSAFLFLNKNVAQLEVITDEVKHVEMQSMRKLASGPGSWILLFFLKT